MERSMIEVSGLNKNFGKRPVLSDVSQFADCGAISSYAKTGMQWAVQSGILHGMGDHTLNPAGNATRAQVAQIFVRLMAE